MTTLEDTLKVRLLFGLILRPQQCVVSSYTAPGPRERSAFAVGTVMVRDSQTHASYEVMWPRA